MLDAFFAWFQGGRLMPRGEAMMWTSTLLGLDVAFNLLIALACAAMLGLLTSALQARPDWRGRGLVRALAVLAFASTAYHLQSIWTVWFAHYRMGLLFQGLLALATIATAIGLRKRLPQIVRAPSPEQFDALQAALVESQSTLQRRTTELQSLQGTVDRQVNDRTQQLESGNRQLQTQVDSLRRAEREFMTEKERALVTLRAIADGVISTDTRARITYLNPVAERITGWSTAEAIGRPISEIFKRTDENTRTPLPDPVAAVLHQGELSALPSQTRLVNRYGQSYSIEDLATPIRNHDGTMLGVVLVFHDVSAARKMANRMSHLAQHDQLTGLPNRLLLHDRLNRAITQARRHGDRVALMFLDLDRFKQINDSLGHLVGDKLLKQAARRLEKCVRASDTVSRQGGDEFVILLPQVADPTAPAEVAQKILAAIGKPFDIDGQTLSLTVSVGVSLYPDDGDSVDALTRSADSAMYHAKSLGRNNFQYFTSNVNQRLDERKALQRHLRSALQRGEFEMHYQPKISLATGEITGAEALLRWNHPKLGQVGPDEFMTSAEESGLIVPIGRWVLEQVCEQSRRWRTHGLPTLPIAVNLSPMQLNERAFVSEITPILNQAHVPPGSIEFELREDATTANRSKLLNEIHDLGVGLSIDDFGAGETSLATLHKLPIDSIKIDGRLVRDASTDPGEAALIRGLIGVSQSLKVKVIAKGIENLEQLQFLRQQGCDEGQGFLFGKPLAANDFERLFERHRVPAAAA